MERELPAGLSDAQRIALSEFFAGRLSAGQLTNRLGIEPTGVAEPALERDRHRPGAVRIPNPFRALASGRSIAPSAPPRPGTR